MMMHKPAGPKPQEVDEFCAEIDALADTFATDMTAALEDCRPFVARSIAKTFASRTTPDYEGWPPRKDIGDGHPLLDESGALKNAATGEGPGHVERIGPDSLEWGVEKINQGGLMGAAVHQYGATIRPVRAKMLHWKNSAGEDVFAKEVHIPARPYLGLWDEDLDEMAETVADYAKMELI